MDAEQMLQALSNRILELDQHVDGRTISYEDTLRFVESKRNLATVSKTRSDCKRFNEWLRGDGEERCVEEIPPNELDMYLSRFILSVRNHKTNKELEPTTIQGIVASIRRYLVEKDYPEDITTSEKFKHSRNTLKAKAKDLKEKGLGNKANRADRFTDEEIRQLYKMKLLGSGDPKSLISTIWLNNTMHLGLRGRQEHVTMLWGDIEICKTNGVNGKQYLEFNERATKTRKGINDDPRAFKPKIWEMKDDPNCPVKMFMLYSEARPTIDPQSRFYLQPNRYYKKSGNWFNNTPMGKDAIGSIASNMSEKAGFSGKHTNHSGRKTFISNLLDKGVHPTEVAQLSGHKNLHSLNHYHTLSIERQNQLSEIIHAPTKGLITSDDNTEMTDNEIFHASQEIEQTLMSIENYEQIPSNDLSEKVQAIDIPVVHSPGGTLGVPNFSSAPRSLFSGCTFNHPVNITFRN